MSQVKFQKTSASVWSNASNEEVPVKYIPKSDVMKEQSAAKIHKLATSVEKSLNELYAIINEATEAIRKQVTAEFSIAEKNLRGKKGNYTWFNFDRSLKVEVEVNPILKWDQALMTEAHAQLNDFLGSSLSDTQEMIRDLVTKAFSNSKGMIDSSRVFQILKYKDKISNKKFQRACELISNAHQVDTTKTYMRVWEKDIDGSYRNINLNFSSI